PSNTGQGKSSTILPLFSSLPGGSARASVGQSRGGACRAAGLPSGVVNVVSAPLSKWRNTRQSVLDTHPFRCTFLPGCEKSEPVGRLLSSSPDCCSENVPSRTTPT